jgi:hypothetical protein
VGGAIRNLLCYVLLITLLRNLYYTYIRKDTVRNRKYPHF